LQSYSIKKEQNKFLLIGSFFAIYIIWGTTYLANAYGVEEVPPFFWGSIRFVSAGIIIFLFMKLRGMDMSLTWEQFKNASFAGFLFLTVGNGLMCWALQYLDSGFMSLLVATQPLILLFMMWVLEGKSPKFMSIIGAILGLLGMYLLINQKAFNFEKIQLIGIGICFVCLIAWGYASLFVARVKLPKSHFLNTAIQMLVGGVLMLLVSSFTEDLALEKLSHISAVSFWGMLYLIFFGSIIAFTAFNYLLQYVSPEKVATSTYINPIVALYVGWYFRDELVTTQSIVAAIVLFIGVYFINTDRFKGQ